MARLSVEVSDEWLVRAKAAAVAAGAPTFSEFVRGCVESGFVVESGSPVVVPGHLVERSRRARERYAEARVEDDDEVFARETKAALERVDAALVPCPHEEERKLMYGVFCGNCGEKIR